MKTSSTNLFGFGAEQHLSTALLVLNYRRLEGSVKAGLNAQHQLLVASLDYWQKL